MSREITVLVGPNEDQAVLRAARDLVRYLREALGEGTVVRKHRLTAKPALPDGDLIVVNPAGTSAALRAGFEKAAGAALELTGDAYAIRIRRRTGARGARLVLLEAAGTMGLQYACYDFARRYLGVRYLRPDFEHVPKRKRLALPQRTDVVETPRYPYRGVWAWAYTDRDIKNNWMEFIYWCTNPPDHFKLLKLADWVVKNRGNVLFWYSETYLRQHMYLPDEYQEYLVMRGLHRVEMVSPASAEGKVAEDMKHICRAKDGSQIGTWNTHLCISKKRFWKVLDEQIERIRPENLLGVMVTWSEASCAQPGRCDDFTKRCATCGHIPNAEKHVKVVEYVKDKLAKRGLDVPVGHYRHWKTGPNGDARHARDVLRRAGDDFLTFIHTCGVDACDIYSAWWKTVRRRNEKGANLKIWYCPETQVMCYADTPIVNVMNFDSREYDYRKLEKNPDTDFHVCNLTTQKYFGWQMAHYTFVNQWGPFVTWREFMHDVCKDTFGEAAAKDIVSAMENLYPVEALTRSRKFGINWERKYWWLYGTEILIDCESSFGIKTLRNFTRKAGTLKRDLSAYARNLDSARSFLADATGKAQRNDALLRKDFTEPILWTVDFLDWRVKLMLALCELPRSPEKALGLVAESLAILERYTFTMQECGKDFPSNIRPQTLAVIKDALADAVADGGRKPSLRSILKTMCNTDETARTTLGKLLGGR